MSTQLSSVSTSRARRKRERVSDVRILTTLPESLSEAFDRLVAHEHSTASATVRRILALQIPRELARFEQLGAL